MLTQPLRFELMPMRESRLKLLGAAVAVLGVLFLIAGAAVAVTNNPRYEAILIVFGAIFLIAGAGLAAVTFFEKNPDVSKQTTKPPPPPPP
jgi:uncharacterized membrane protein HdeD (DUF308 family)